MGTTNRSVGDQKNIREEVTELQVLWSRNTKAGGEGFQERSTLSRCAHRALGTSFYFPFEMAKMTLLLCYVKVVSIGNACEA